MSVVHWIVLLPFGAICAFQLYYLIRSLGTRPAPVPLPHPPADRPIDILIPVYNSAATLDEALRSILGNDTAGVSRVVIVLDRCVDASAAIAERFRASAARYGLEVVVTPLPPGAEGKVAAILHGAAFLRSTDVLLMDSDIVLAPTALTELAAFHRAEGHPFSACLIFPHQRPGTASSLVDHVICNNRLYRQGVLQSVKALSGAANFPGGLQLVVFPAYRALLRDGFLEDLTATYRVLSRGGRIALLPRVLAYEIERQTLTGLFLQRVRWTIGTLQHLPDQVRTAQAQRSVHRWILINSYHVMWEFQHYAVVAGLVAAPLMPAAMAPVLLAPLALYTLQILRSVAVGSPHYRNARAAALLHCVIFPTVITAALMGALLMMVRKRGAYFTTDLLFRRL